MSKELGTLVIVVLKGQNLIDNHTFYKQDPYAKLTLSGATKQTPADPKGGQHPVWDTELRFPISRDPSKSNRTLTISVFSSEKKEDELLGEGTVDITDTLKSGEFDDWVPLSLKGTQRGEAYLEMTFFAAGPAPLTQRPSKFTSPTERLARPQQPVAQAQRPQRVVSQPPPSFLTPGGQGSQANSHDGPRQGRLRVRQQVPLPGPWPGRSGQQQQQQQQPTQPTSSSYPPRQPTRDEDAPLPPIPPDVGPKEEFVPSILRPGGPSRPGVQPIQDMRTVPANAPAQGRHSAGTPSPVLANGATNYHHMTPSDTGPNTYTTNPHPVHRNSLTFSGSPVPQARVPSYSPQPEQQPQPHARQVSSPSSYPTHRTPEHVVFIPGGHATAQPSQAQPEPPQPQYYSQPQQPPQQRRRSQHSPRPQAQPPVGQFGHHATPYPHDSQPYAATPTLPSLGQSHVATSSPAPPSHSYVTSQTPSPPTQSPPAPHGRPYPASQTPPPAVLSQIASQNPPVMHGRPYTANPASPAPPGASVPFNQPHTNVSSPVPPAQLYAMTPVPPTQPHTAPTNPVAPAQPYAGPMSPAPPAQQYAAPMNPAPPAQQYAPMSPALPVQPYAAPTGPAPYAAPTSPPPPAQPYVSPAGTILAQRVQSPAQHTTPSPPAQPYLSPPASAYPLVTSPPPNAPYGSSYAPGPAPSFPAPSFPVPQAPVDYFETATAAPFSPHGEPDLPDPYLLKRYQTPLPLPSGASHMHGSGQSAKPKPRPSATAPAMPPAVSAQRDERSSNENGRAVREFQRLEEERMRARREQEERDAELARTLDLELNMGDPGHPSQVPPYRPGIVGDARSQW